MSEGLSSRAIALIAQMRLAARSDMPDMVGVEAVQELAEVIARAEGRLSEEDIVTLICIGAMLTASAEAEIKAGIIGFLAINRAKGPRP